MRVCCLGHVFVKLRHAGAKTFGTVVQACQFTLNFSSRHGTRSALTKASVGNLVDVLRNNFKRVLRSRVVRVSQRRVIQHLGVVIQLLERSGGYVGAIAQLLNLGLHFLDRQCSGAACFCVRKQTFLLHVQGSRSLGRGGGFTDLCGKRNSTVLVLLWRSGFDDTKRLADGGRRWHVLNAAPVHFGLQDANVWRNLTFLFLQQAELLLRSHVGAILFFPTLYLSLQFLDLFKVLLGSLHVASHDRFGIQTLHRVAVLIPATNKAVKVGLQAGVGVPLFSGDSRCGRQCRAQCRYCLLAGTNFLLQLFYSCQVTTAQCRL